MFGLGIWELLIVLAIVVVLFGAKRLPLIGEGLGGMITNFKKATKKNKEEQPKIDDNSAENADDNNDVKEGPNFCDKSRHLNDSFETCRTRSELWQEVINESVERS